MKIEARGREAGKISEIKAQRRYNVQWYQGNNPICPSENQLSAKLLPPSWPPYHIHILEFLVARLHIVAGPL